MLHSDFNVGLVGIWGTVPFWCLVWRFPYLLFKTNQNERSPLVLPLKKRKKLKSQKARCTGEPGFMPTTFYFLRNLEKRHFQHYLAMVFQTLTGELGSVRSPVLPDSSSSHGAQCSWSGDALIGPWWKGGQLDICLLSFPLLFQSVHWLLSQHDLQGDARDFYSEGTAWGRAGSSAHILWGQRQVLKTTVRASVVYPIAQFQSMWQSHVSSRVLHTGSSFLLCFLLPKGRKMLCLTSNKTLPQIRGRKRADVSFDWLFCVYPCSDWCVVLPRTLSCNSSVKRRF